MKRIVIEVETDLHKNFRKYCFAKDKSMKLVLTALMIKALESDEK